MDSDFTYVQVSLEVTGCTYVMNVPQSHVDTILQMHNFMAQNGMPAIEIRTLPQGNDKE